MTDDQGWGDVSYNGLKQIQTPTLDAMAAAGLRFNRFYAQQSCSPTRASVMTGRHPNRMGVFWPGMPLRRQEITIAQAAKTAGYATGHFGKWHLNGVAGPGKPIAAADPLGPGRFGFDESFSVSNYFELDWTFSRNGRTVKVDRRRLGCHRRGGPEVHRPDRARRSSRSWPSSGSAVRTPRTSPCPRTSRRPAARPTSAKSWAWTAAWARCAAGCASSASPTTRWSGSTATTAGGIDPAQPDAHGVNGGLRGRKGDMWEGGIRVPGVIEWPARIKRPVVTDVPAGVIDIYPTIVDILQAKVPNQVNRSTASACCR